jgi:hypothetical protein
MTRDDLVLLAHKADCLDPQQYGGEWMDKLLEFAKLVRAYQRQHVTYVCPICAGSLMEEEKE